MLRVGLHDADGGLLAGDEHPVVLLRRHHGAQLQAVVQGHQSAVEAQNDGERPCDQQAGIHGAQIRQLPRHRRGLATDGAPEGGGDHRRRFLQRQPLTPQKVVGDVGDDLRIRLQGAFIAEHLDIPAVGVVGGYLAVVDDGPVQQGKGVRAAPPAGSVGRIAAMGRPAVRLVLLQTVEPAHILRIAHGLEGAHVLAAGEYICAL